MGCSSSTANNSNRSNNNENNNLTSANIESVHYMEFNNENRCKNVGTASSPLDTAKTMAITSNNNSKKNRNTRLSQTSVNSGCSQKARSTARGEDYSCGLFKLSSSTFNFCHRCHNNQTQPEQRHSTCRNKTDNKSCKHGKYYPKQISASLTGLHSIVDCSSICSNEECVRLSSIQLSSSMENIDEEQLAKNMDTNNNNNNNNNNQFTTAIDHKNCKISSNNNALSEIPNTTANATILSINPIASSNTVCQYCINESILFKLHRNDFNHSSSINDNSITNGSSIHQNTSSSATSATGTGYIYSSGGSIKDKYRRISQNLDQIIESNDDIDEEDCNSNDNNDNCDNNNNNNNNDNNKIYISNKLTRNKSGTTVGNVLCDDNNNLNSSTKTKSDMAGRAVVEKATITSAKVTSSTLINNQTLAASAQPQPPLLSSTSSTTIKSINAQTGKDSTSKQQQTKVQAQPQPSSPTSPSSSSSSFSCCCRHQHLLDQLINNNGSSTDRLTNNQLILNTTNYNIRQPKQHHPYCCLNLLATNVPTGSTKNSETSNKIINNRSMFNAPTATTMANCFSLVQPASNSLTNTMRTHPPQTISDQTLTQKCRNLIADVNDDQTAANITGNNTAINTNISMADQFIQFGRMNIELKQPNLLLVFPENVDRSQALLLSSAAETAGYNVTLVDSTEAAINSYADIQHELIIIDIRNFLRNSKNNNNNNKSTNKLEKLASTDTANPLPTRKIMKLSFSKKSTAQESKLSPISSHSTTSTMNYDQQANKTNNCHFSYNFQHPFDLCKSIRNIKGSEYTTICALVERSLFDDDDLSIFNLEFNRFLPETSNKNNYVNELVQLREFELKMQYRLRAASTLFTALDRCKDGVLITGPNHDIRFANAGAEKMFHTRLEDMIGQKTEEFFQNDAMKPDVNEKINNYNEGKEWEGLIYHRRKSGDSVPIWTQILPINYRKGVPEYVIYIKESFFSIEKFMCPEKEYSSSYGSQKGPERFNSLRKVSICESRRPSLAKFSSISLIEQPIIKVVNILMAIKENCPISMVPTMDKAIDILKNSEVLTPQLQNIRADDPVTSELVCSLINSNNKALTRRMSHDVVSNKSSLPNNIHFLLPSANIGANSSNNNNNNSSSSTGNNSNNQHHYSTIMPADIKKLLDDNLKWNFDVIELERITNRNPLVWLGLSIFERFNVCQTLNCSESTARQWLSVIESNYRNHNPYHNSTHAADVAQATAYFLMSKRLSTIFDPLDQAICLIAAIIHDIDHPGRNSSFLANSNHDLALLYNDISVLESHHAAYGFKLTVGANSDHINIFKNLDQVSYREVRQSIVDMVLATEMTKHFEHLSKFVNVFQTYGDNDLEKFKSSNKSLDQQPDTDSIKSVQEIANQPENIVLIKRMLIKCADVSNPGRSTKLCEIWANRIASEYCDQTEEEKSKGLPVVMPTFDKKNCSIPQSQIGFIDFFANEMFEAWHAFGDFPEMVENMNINYKYWSNQLVESKQKERSVEIEEIDEENMT